MHQLALLHRVLSPESVLQALQDCVGEANGLTATRLVEMILGTRSAADERRLRQIVEHLRLQGHRICAHPTSGYYLAANPAEVDCTCAFLVQRAMTSLRQACAMRRVAVPDLYGQLGLPLTPETSHEPDERNHPSVPVPGPGGSARAG